MRRIGSKRAQWVFACAMLWALARPAFADAPPIAWTAPAECPTGQEVSARVRTLLRQGQGSAPGLRADARIAAERARYRLRLEDAVQDTFVVVHRRLSDLRPEAPPKGFLFAIALRVAHDYRRSARRKGASSLDAERELSRELGPFERMQKAQAARLLEQFLAALDEDKRAVFVLAELEDMSAPEIGEALSVKLNTVYSRLRVARERFVAFLASQGERHE